MLINTGGRTDTVQYFSDWLLKRFKDGVVYSRNPLFPNKVTRYELTPNKVDCVIFCSKNYGPILPRLHEITDRFNTYFFYTITAYGKDVEPGVPSVDQSIDILYKLEKQVGKNRIVWRYDPVLLTKKYTIQQHLITFGHMAARLSGHVSRCVFSFVELYEKLQFNMPELQLLTEEDMEELAEGFDSLAKKYRLPIQTCATKTDYSRFGIMPSGCLTLEAIGEANGVKFRSLKHKGMRSGCKSGRTIPVQTVAATVMRIKILSWRLKTMRLIILIPKSFWVKLRRMMRLSMEIRRHSWIFPTLS